MSRLSLYLLGPPRVAREGEPIEVNTSKGIALLAYLALTRGRQRRDALVNLLWPESDQARGRTNLRSTLYALRQTLGGDWLDVDRESIGLAVNEGAPTRRRTDLELTPAIVSEQALWLDVDQFHARLEVCHGHGHLPSEVCPACLTPLVAAVDLYRGEFLSGFTLKDSFNFDDWQFFQTESLRREFSDALDRLVRCYIAQREFEPAIRRARQWLALDRLNESAHRQLMRLHAWSGQPSVSLRQYEECVRMLESQLGAAPQEATTDLYRAIAASRIPEPPVRVRAPLLETRESEQTGSVRAMPPKEIRVPLAGPAPILLDGAKRLVVVLSANIGRSFSAQGGTNAQGGTSARDGPSPEDQALLTVRFHGALQEILSRYGGESARMVGSSVLALFGKRQTRESDPELAVRAAVEARQKAQELGLVLTAGVATGEIYAGAGGQGRDPMLAGGAIDRALSLASEARPGQILAGETTYRLTQRAFEWHALASGIAGADPSANLYQVGDLLIHPRKARGIEGMKAELIGRDEELSRLEDALAQVLRGRGQMVSLVGEAGVGKSRLVAELKQAAFPDTGVEPNPLWLEGRCLDLGTAPSYAPFVDILHALWSWGAREADLRRYERLTQFLAELVEQNYLGQERAGELAAFLGRLLFLPIGPQREAELGSEDPGQTRTRTFLALCDLIHALCHRQPVVLVFEDLHWADSLSIDLISLLMEQLGAVPLLLLCAYRPAREHPCWHLATIAAQKCPERYTEIRLRELTRDQSREMVSSLLASPSLSPPVRDLIMDQAQGNPFFIEEVIRATIDSGIVYQEEGIWRVRQEIASLTVPTSVQSAILGRVDRLDQRLKHVLNAAAVIGRVFRLRVLAHTLGQASELETDLWELEDQALIYRERLVPEIEYSFKHVLTQETVYQGILSDRRSSLHRRVAKAIESLYSESLDEHYERLAHHYEEGGEVEQAIAYLFKAGQKARRSYANVEAIAHLTRGLALLETLPETAERDRRELDLQLALGVPLVHVRGHADPQVERAYSRAAELCAHLGDASQRLQAWVGLRRYHLLRGEFSRAHTLSNQLLSMAQEVGDPLHVSWAHLMQGEVLYYAGKFVEAMEHFTRALELCDSLPARAHVTLYGNDARVFCSIIGALATWQLGYPDRARAMSREALARAMTLAYPFSQVSALAFSARLDWLCRDARTTREKVEAMMPVSLERGFTLFTVWGKLLRGWALNQQRPEPSQGQEAPDSREIDEGIAVWRESGAAMALPNSVAALVQALDRTGRVEQALRLVDEALDLVERNGERCWEAELYRLRGELMLKLQAAGTNPATQIQDAELCFRRAIVVAQRQNAKSWELRAATSLARLWHGQGKTRQARELLRGIYDWFTEGFDTLDLKDARTLLEAMA